MVKRILLVISILTIAFMVGACSTGFTPAGKGSPPVTPAPATASAGSGRAPTNGMVQSHDGGSVVIEVEWANSGSDSLVFDVAMNTHSVELDQYDLKKLATLRDDSGKEYQPLSWKAASGGHHRSGTLTFPMPESVTQGNAKYVEMIIRDVAGIKERVLKWEL